MTIGYDAIGNPLSYNGWSFAWQQGRQLKSMSGNGYSLDITYKVICEDNAGTKLCYTYDNAGTLISMNYDGANYYYVRNAQNDVIGLIDQDGSWVVKYAYDSWGKLISIDGSLKDTVGVKNPYRYRGYRYDTETGLYYLNSRYYNPEWGRFINADSIVGQTGELLSHNMFIYCMNNPINMIDDIGYLPKWVGTALKIGIAVTVVAAVTVVTCGAGDAVVIPTLIAEMCGGCASAASNAYIQYKQNGKIDGGEVALNFAGGYFSGMFACTDAPLLGQALMNGAIGYATVTTNTFCEGRLPTKKELITNISAGVVGGIAGGKGAGGNVGYWLGFFGITGIARATGGSFGAYIATSYALTTSNNTNSSTSGSSGGRGGYCYMIN